MKFDLGILGHTLKAANYRTLVEGHEHYSNQEFDYLPIGGLHMKMSNGFSYSIADFNSTSLGTSGVGLKKIAAGQNDLTLYRVSRRISHLWHDKIGQEVTSMYIYYRNENNSDKLSVYPESLQIEFNNGKSIYYFCGEVEGFDEKKDQYLLLGGRSSGIIFFDLDTFRKYGLDQVEKIEKVT